jgi:hypothetical protein
MIIKGDNKGSISLTKNPQFHQRSKHIALHYHWIRKFVKDKVFDIESTRDPEQTADILTKPIPRLKHVQHTSEMGIN